MSVSPRYLGAIDQGTTSTRFMVFDRAGRCVSIAQREHQQFYPQPGWVEHDPQEILARACQVIAEALDQAALKSTDLAGVGIANQRETTVLWDRKTGQPVMAIGGFMGIDPILTPERLAALVADHQVRFVLLGGDFARRGGGEAPLRAITEWVKANGAPLDEALWRSAPPRAGGPGRNVNPELYDLRSSDGLAPATSS